jgi:hypothetical protein
VRWLYISNLTCMQVSFIYSDSPLDKLLSSEELTRCVSLHCFLAFLWTTPGIAIPSYTRRVSLCFPSFHFHTKSCLYQEVEKPTCVSLLTLLISTPSLINEFYSIYQTYTMYASAVYIESKSYIRKERIDPFPSLVSER